MTDTEMTGEVNGDGQEVWYKCDMGKQELRNFANWLGGFEFMMDGQEGLLPGEAPPKPYLLAKVQMIHVDTGKPLQTLHRHVMYKNLIGEVPRLDRLLDDGKTDQVRIGSKALLDKLLAHDGTIMSVDNKATTNLFYKISVVSVARRNEAKGTIFNPDFKEYNDDQLTNYMTKVGVKKVEAITKRGKTAEERIPTGVYILTFHDVSLPKEIFVTTGISLCVNTLTIRCSATTACS